MATAGTHLGALGVAPNTAEMLEVVADEKEHHRMSVDGNHPGIRQRQWGIEARTDPNVTFEEYIYWAKVERDLEQEDNRKYIEEQGPWSIAKAIKGRFSKGVHHDRAKKEQGEQEKRDQSLVQSDSQSDAIPPQSLRSTDEEWRVAARALRTASWGTIFFLVTTDILGWSNTPYVFSSVGFGLGVGIFVIFGIAAAASGFFIWRVFLGLDSSRFPIMSYGDPFHRLFGPRWRHFINIMQSLQQFLSVTVVLLGNSQLLVQIARNRICYVICFVIVMAVGIISGSIRSLQRIGWFCNLSVWFNIATFLIVIAAAAKFPPYYGAVTGSTLIQTIEPIKTFIGVPTADYQQQSRNLVAAQLNGVDQMVYSYSGALLFFAFLAEMRHPMDFWKGMLLAQTFICVVYVVFGAVVYSLWGQYSSSNITQAIGPYGLQTAGNVLSLLTGFFAIFLYFNVGMKTVYLEVFQDALNFPPIITKKGKWLWFLLGPIYWILAFVVAAAVPNLNGIVSFVGALFSLNFTYSIPAVLYTAFSMQHAAVLPGEGFDPATGVTTRHDSGWQRWKRGYLKGWYITIPTTIFFLGGFACSGLGVYASIEGLIAVFGPGGTHATSFGCTSPIALTPT